MTLNVTSSQIQIKNSLGQVKFTSTDKLIYRKHYQTGTVTFTGYNYTPYPTLATNDFVVLNIVIHSCTAERYPSALTGILIPTARPLVTAFQINHYTTINYADIWTGHTSCGVVDGYIVFSNTLWSNIYYSTGNVFYESVEPTYTYYTTSLTYYAATYSYL